MKGRFEATAEVLIDKVSGSTEHIEVTQADVVSGQMKQNQPSTGRSYRNPHFPGTTGTTCPRWRLYMTNGEDETVAIDPSRVCEIMSQKPVP